MTTHHNSTDGLFPRRELQVERDDEPTNLSKALSDPWALAVILFIATLGTGLMGSVEVAQTRPLAWEDAVYGVMPLLGVGILGPVIVSGWLRKTVFAADGGLQFEHRGQWWEVAWVDVGELRRAAWDYRWRNALHYVDILDGSQPRRVYFVPTRDAVAFIDYYRAESGGQSGKQRGRSRRK